MTLKKLQTSIARWITPKSESRFAPLNFWKPIARYPDDVFNIPVLVVRYFPIQGELIDIAVTNDIGGPMTQVRRHTAQTTQRVIHALETGSIYHGYQNPDALPSLRYQVVDTLEFLEPMPLWNNPKHRQSVMVDYKAVMERVDARQWVEQRGVKEIWLWGYHTPQMQLWESNMAGPYGDISNSDRNLDDLPVFKHTYTVYHYNYGRHTSEAVEDHMHQIEALLGHVDHEMFWDRFVGNVLEGRCGWSHYPPNGLKDYDWNNPRYVQTDIEAWSPEGTGPKREMTSMRWYGNSLTWFIYWMQNLPGRDNNLSFLGHKLTNWWAFVGSFDNMMASGSGLVME